MAEKKVIAVIGATGAQGGGLVRAILADRDGPFVARAITRKLDSDKARALAQLGVEVVAGDADDPPSLDGALAGAHGAYCVTNFWEHFSADREATQSDCWRLGFMALMPGALMMMIAIFLYGAERIKLTDLLIAWPLHLVIGLGYAIGAILFLPTAGTTPVKTANPFAPGCSPAVSRSAAESPPPRS